MAAGEFIEVSVEMADFDDEPAALVALSDALIQGQPMRARITYRFGPIDGARTSTGYDWRIFGGEREENQISPELRRYLHLVYLHALRDVESDIAGWRRSPLRALLEAAAAAVSPDELAEVTQAIELANNQVTELAEIRDLGTRISSRTRDMVGDSQALD